MTVRTHETSPPDVAQKHIAGCDQGRPTDCHAAALDAYYLPKSPLTDKSAFDLFSKGCKLDYAPSCNGLGVLFAEGRGVTQDEHHAVELYRLSCERGGSTGCDHLAAAKVSGHGTQTDAAGAERATARGKCIFEASLHDKSTAACPALDAGR